VINSFKEKMNKWAWVRVILLATFSTLMLVNSMSFKSPVIGISTSLAVVCISSVATSDIFFYKEKKFLKTALGLATFILIITMLGTFLILMVAFTETVSLVSFVVVGLILCLISVFRKRVNVQQASERSGKDEGGNKESYLLVFPFLLSVAIAVNALLIARTGEGEVSVWLTVPNFFLPVFFVSTLSLIIMLFFTEMNIGLKLALISVHSFLSHSVFLLVWYPGRYGDPWTYLGHARYVDINGAFYAYKWLYSQRLIADIIRYKAQYALVVLFRRMFSFDIYWVHVFLIPLLWSLFAPIFSYKIAELLAAKNTTRFPLFCAIGASLFPSLIYSGAVSTTFSLGLLFLMCSIMLTLYWVNTNVKRFLFLSILAAVVSSFAHPETGIFALVFFFAAVVVQNRLHGVLKIVFIAPIFGVYPLVSYIENATFSLGGLLDPNKFLSFQFDLVTLPLVFGFVGVMFGIRGKLVKSRSALMLSLFYVITVVNYYVSMYGMKKAVAPDRLLSIADLFLLPFVGFGLLLTTNFLENAFSRVKASHLRNPVTSHSVSLLIFCLFLSLLATSALYQTYPRDEITKVQPAAYEVEAVRFLDSNTTGRYIVLGDTNLATIAGGFLGIDYSYGASSAKGDFGMPQWDWWVQRLYSQMVTKPSVQIMEEAMAKDAAIVAYFVVSVREGKYFDDIVLRTSEVMPIYKDFGDGKLYVFKYPYEGVPGGPRVKVTFDDGTTTEAYAVSYYTDWSDVTYVVWLTGHSSYNISDYPEHWTFLSLQVNFQNVQFDNRSDVNSFIYVAELLPSDILEVTWHANNLYKNVGWKDDSFKYGWQTRPGYPGTILPNITTYGNVLSLSWNFTPGQYQYYYYVKPVSVSTRDYQYMLVRWRSTGPVAYVTVSYAPEGEAAIVRINSESSGWTVARQSLWVDTSTAFVTVGITNLNNQDISGPQTVYIDYILICGTS
jgi:hypothetical protein